MYVWEKWAGRRRYIVLNFPFPWVLLVLNTLVFFIYSNSNTSKKKEIRFLVLLQKPTNWRQQMKKRMFEEGSSQISVSCVWINMSETVQTLKDTKLNIQTCYVVQWGNGFIFSKTKKRTCVDLDRRRRAQPSMMMGNKSGILWLQHSSL